MTTPQTIAAEAAPQSQLAGYVEAVDGGRILGWAWDRANPRERIQIRVTTADGSTIETLADRPRADLQTNGIGDGRHAFEVALPADTATERFEIVAIGPCGTLDLDTTPPPAAPEVALGNLQIGIGQLIDSQRFVLRNLQAVMTAVRNPGTADLAPGSALEGVERAQQTLAGQIESIETYLVRLDATLATLHEGLSAARAKPAHDPKVIAGVMAGTLFSLIAAAAAMLAAFR